MFINRLRMKIGEFAHPRPPPAATLRKYSSVRLDVADRRREDRRRNRRQQDTREGRQEQARPALQDEFEIGTAKGIDVETCSSGRGARRRTDRAQSTAKMSAKGANARQALRTTMHCERSSQRHSLPASRGRCRKGPAKVGSHSQRRSRVGCARVGLEGVVDNGPGPSTRPFRALV